MAVEMQHTGAPAVSTETRAVIEHVLADRPGDWRISIVGSQANDRWEMNYSWAEWVRALLYAGGFCGAARARLHRVASGSDGAEMSSSRPHNQLDPRARCMETGRNLGD